MLDAIRSIMAPPIGLVAAASVETSSRCMPSTRNSSSARGHHTLGQRQTQAHTYSESREAFRFSKLGRSQTLKASTSNRNLATPSVTDASTTPDWQEPL